MDFVVVDKKGSLPIGTKRSGVGGGGMMTVETRGGRGVKG